ncbi:hypothetical protein [Conyzicola sp.]|uniref:hypothetical protein n=1 Tax=Conyzicola sp. TaxID=1969404 RepID=UPI003989AF54
MIIESGIDVLQVLCGSVSNDNPRGLWIIATDADLRLLYVEPVALLTAGGVEDHVDDVAGFLEGARDVAYYVLAWTSETEVDPQADWLLDLDRRLREDPDLAVARLLGIIVFDGSRLYSSLPRCDFSIERGFQDLPRAMALAGPHGLDCSCPPCAAERRAFDDSMDDYRFSGDSYDDEYYDGSYGDEPYVPSPAYSGSARGRSRRGRSRRRPRLYDPDYEPPMALDGAQFDQDSNRWYPPPDRAGKRWTHDEEQTIAVSHEQGLSCFDISLLVQRQPGAIARRLNKLGLSSSTLSKAF